MLKADWDALGKRLGYANEQEMFIDLYMVKHISVIELGKRLGFTQATIARRLDLCGIPKRPRGGSNNEHFQKFRLWRFDQRVLRLPNKQLVAEMVGVSYATLKFYLDSCTNITWPRRPDGVLHNQPD